MRQYCLFLAITQLISEMGCPATNPTYNSMNPVEEDACGVYIRGGILPRGRSLATGRYLRKADRVQLLLQTGRTKESILSWENFVRNIEDRMPEVFNRSFELASTKIGFDSVGNFTTNTNDIVTGVRVMFMRTDPQSGVLNIGRSSQGLTRYSCNYVIEYSIDSYALN